jgi:signal recognition particle subunit SRP54
MEPSSQTPEGERSRCPVCGKKVRIEPSRPPGDAPCPHCGHLLWFEPQDLKIDEGESGKQEGGARELVESALQQLAEEESAEHEARQRQGEFTLVDFQRMISQTKKVGPITKVLGMLPGMGGLSQRLAEADSDKDLRRLAAIIEAMTPEERRNPKDILDESRRRRVAKGAGVIPTEVAELVQQFDSFADLMKKMSGMGLLERARRMQRLQKGIGPGKRLTPEERARLNQWRRNDDTPPQ